MNIKDIIIKNNFHYKKSLGQSFIADGNLLDAIVRDSGAGPLDTVVEIGTGAGTLTAALSAKVKRVFSFEVDESLRPILAETLKGRENVTVIFRDVLRLCDAEITDIIGDSPFRLVANLPYYITSPLIMRFLESSLKAESLTVMVQKEVGERLTARYNTKEYSAATLAVALYGNAKILRIVKSNMFFPVPKVDSALLRIDVVPNKYELSDKDAFLKFVNAAFAMRRKTLSNNLAAAYGLNKNFLENALVSSGFSASVRGEALSMDDFLKLHGILFKKPEA